MSGSGILGEVVELRQRQLLGERAIQDFAHVLNGFELDGLFEFNGSCTFASKTGVRLTIMPEAPRMANARTHIVDVVGSCCSSAQSLKGDTFMD